jgi:hypothetical protein
MQYDNIDFVAEMKENRLRVVAKLLSGERIPSLKQAEITAIVQEMNHHLPIIVHDELATGSPTPLVVTERMVTYALEELAKELEGPSPVNLPPKTGFVVEEAPPAPADPAAPGSYMPWDKSPEKTDRPGAPPEPEIV